MHDYYSLICTEKCYKSLIKCKSIAETYTDYAIYCSSNTTSGHLYTILLSMILCIYENILSIQRGTRLLDATIRIIVQILYLCEIG